MSLTLSDRITLSLPGLWIDMVDRNLAFTIYILLQMAVDQFNEAVLACELFTPLHTQRVSTREEDCVTPINAKNSTLIAMYAKAFVHSLDATRSFLFVLARQQGLPAYTVDACCKFKQDFGYVRDIRNSIQHIEERAQGLAQGGKLLDVRLILLGNFIGNRFGFTTDKSGYAEVEISESTLQLVRVGLERVIWSVKWLGPGSTPIPSPSFGDA